MKRQKKFIQRYLNDCRMAQEKYGCHNEAEIIEAIVYECSKELHPDEEYIKFLNKKFDENNHQNSDTY